MANFGDIILAGLILALLVLPASVFLLAMAAGRGWAWGRGDILVVHKTLDEYDREQKEEAEAMRKQLSEPDEL